MFIYILHRGHIFRNLKELFPTHACQKHIENFKILETESGYSEFNIPQLEDVSNFLKRKSCLYVLCYENIINQNVYI